ncbi:UDP-glucose 4-epimerase GalE [Enterococcus cecorum]|uniref:UDP-glucose 4-epimerase n=1 Tax=Enterococcus cecorum DSM 20682 = ATCC 43198 TaxID=1121864 RepID=S1QX85_9ENTE|nr:UDP-glucose 4-epimerase GalE [Enterococcus cecorum]EOX17528.1 UDP-glucose 4-epimerase [Enterococcus cecorum DSM 20682 = ATCC 43198]ESK60697.1 UDP-glucose 4-epimerase [Enterococcus cecorum DSM 20682 = ATCC 43198]OJG32333.1 UDP-glucose 4-epimerase [Enterococcus cecorum DSM 20682 = ATCC 43198]CAI3397854.1 UDP-glucose 4-epimerase GalE [Enterococcus cecorum DSM 20682 = ATCC 43198]SQE54291.1 UDP-glucose 4-epimerase [Enterococcus cecorum]
MKILVSGGTGYIGSHTVIELISSGQEVVCVDNFANSKKKSITTIEKISKKNIPFYCVDIRNKEKLREIFRENNFDACIHFAALKAVGESVYKPLEYYDNNLSGTLTLLEVMKEFNCKNLIFSSSATVYGNPSVIPITENCPKGEITNPYGQTKSMIEQILMDLHKADIVNESDNPWNIVLLRYFNPIGAHQSGLIGEDPSGVPNNLMPYITQVALGKLDYLNVFGNDYDTPDGTGVRDYIHVVDLARGHVHALKAIEENCGLEIFNLGTGKGTSVLELVHAFEKVTGVKVPYKFVERRPGDIATCYADASKAKEKLGWVAKYDIEDMCRDAWRWQKMNPNGYEDK